MEALKGLVMKRSFLVLLLAFCLTGIAVAEDMIKAASSEAQLKPLAEQLGLEIIENALSNEECKMLGSVPQLAAVTSLLGTIGASTQEVGKVKLNIDYDGRGYRLVFKNRADTVIKNFIVLCRFYYTVKKSWVQTGYDSKPTTRPEMVQDYFTCSLKIPLLLPGTEYKTNTAPFVLESFRPPSGYHRRGGEATIIECRPKGLWVRVFSDGGTHIDFCEPSSLTSDVTW